MRGEGFQDMDLGEIKKLVDITLKKLIEEYLMEISACKPEPDTEEEDVEAVPENKVTLDNLAECSNYSRMLLTPYMTWAFL